MPNQVGTTVSFRPGSLANMDAVLRLFDKAVEWLVANGREGQWGSEPWSTNPHRRERVRLMLDTFDLVVAESDGALIGALVTGNRAPEYIPPVSEPELYIHLLIGSASHRGAGIGSQLLDHARDLARDAGVSLLRVDSWGGGDRQLVRYYESQGFTPVESFERGDWVGQVYEQRLD